MATSSSAPRITIASYRPVKAWSIAILGFAVLMFLVYITFFSYHGHLVSNSASTARGIYIIPALVLAWLSVPLALAALLAGVWQLIFDGRRAVWIEQGTLIFLRKWIFAVECNKIERVSAGTIKRYKNEAVILQLRGGTQKEIPTGSLVESREVIISRLCEVLGIVADL